MSFTSLGDLFDETEQTMDPRHLVIPDRDEESAEESAEETLEDGAPSIVSEAPERGQPGATTTVSYTHLTLPTKA